jgi:hypothetical protein
MAYNKDNATAFNQLIQQGTSVADAAAQSGVDANAASYGSGTNANAGAIIPGAGGDVVTSGLTQVSYPQPSIAVDAQPALKSNALPPVVDPRVIVATPAAQTTNTPVPVNTLSDPEQQAEDFLLLPNRQVAEQVALNEAAPVSTFSDPQQQAQAALADQIAATTPAPVSTFSDPAQRAQAALANQIAATAPALVDITTPTDARLAAGTQTTPLNAATDANSNALVGTQLAQRGAVLEAQRKLVNNGDWRVRLSLAAGADYLYNATPNGILWPLKQTGGVIFPYMPKIDVAYKADYEPYSLTHSNYKGYFYKSSYTDAVTLTATFTAQDTSEANYLLAVIHFFRSVTKMFYGQDAQRGAPPPLVYLTGLGEYQFAAHPCVVSSFQYSLPNDVDYIRAGSPNINGTNLITRRARQDLPTNPITGAVKRLENLFSSQGINKGAITSPPAPPTLGKNSPTYVPTKIECSINLLPMQTRAQVSQVFSLKSFANGDLIKGGFW